MDSKKKFINKYFFEKKYFHFNEYDWVKWLHFFALIISIFSPIFCISTAVITAIENNNWSLLWFTNFDTWTYQTNCLITFYVWFSFWKPNFKFFKDHNFLVSITVYIAITFLFFNTYYLINLLGGMPNKNDVIDSNPQNIKSIQEFYITSSAWNHVINPTFFIILSFSLMIKENKTIHYNLTRYVFITMIYPSIYTLYLILIPWSGFMDDGTNSYSVYGVFTQTKYNNTTWLWIPPLYVLIPITLIGMWYLKQHLFNKYQNKSFNTTLNIENNKK